MKKKYIYTLLTALALASCEKTVEVKPLGFVAPNQVITNITGLQNVLNSAYDRFQDFGWYGRDMALLGDVLTDNVYTDPGISAGGGRYTNNNKDVLNSTFGFWSTAYLAINDLNTVLVNADLVGGSATAVAQLKGEAYGLRALAYFDLARTYAYEPGLAPASGVQIPGFGPPFTVGVVIRLTPTTDFASGAPLPRATIAATYAQIESDFQAAISNLPPIALTATSTAKFKMNLYAAEALYGKALLYESKYAAAIAQFNLALAAPGVGLAPAGTYAAMFNSATPVLESYFEVGQTANEMAGVTGVNNSLHSYTTPTYKDGSTSTFGAQTPSDELVAALNNANDDRKAVIYKFGGAGSTVAGQAGTFTGTAYNWCSKYPAPILPANTSFADNVKVIRYADVLLMKAEASAANGDPGTAVTLVNQLHTSRNNATVVTAAGIVQTIRDERRLELFFEGQRFFDEKRWNIGLTKASKTAVGAIAFDDVRLLAPIPTGEVNIVGKLILPQNPGY